MRCLAKAPADRYESADALDAALAACAVEGWTREPGDEPHAGGEEASTDETKTAAFRPPINPNPAQESSSGHTLQ
jgi:hypothetical protein